MEQVYCVKASSLPEPRETVLPLSTGLYRQLVSEGEFLVRGPVEEDESWRQIIPYAVIRRDHEVFVVERLRAGSEARLHDLWSVGIGGHVNSADKGFKQDPIETALVRELREELELGAFRADAVGLIHSGADAVSRVHTGVLYLVHTPGEVKVKETEKLRGRFVAFTDLQTNRDRLEGWSRLALEFLTAKVLQTG